MIRLFSGPVSKMYHSADALQSAGQVDELWVDASVPPTLVALVDSVAEHQTATDRRCCSVLQCVAASRTAGHYLSAYIAYGWQEGAWW